MTFLQAGLAAIAISLMHAGGAAAQSPPCHVQVAANLVLKQGGPPPSVEMPPITLDPRDGTIVAVKNAPPRRVLLLVDASGSMRQGNAWRAAAAHARELVESLPAPVQLGVARVTDEVRLIGGYRAPPSGYAAALTDLFAQLNPKGGTALYDAIVAALGRGGALRAGDAIVADSDGGDDASRASSDAARDAMQQAGVRFFLLVPNRSEPRSNFRSSRSFAEASGGAVEPDGAQLGQLLANQLEISIEISSGRADLHLHPAPQLKGARLLSASKPPACAP